MPPEPTRFLTLGPAAHRLGCRVGPDSFFLLLHLARHAERDLMGELTVTASYRQLKAQVGLSKDTIARCLDHVEPGRRRRAGARRGVHLPAPPRPGRHLRRLGSRRHRLLTRPPVGTPTVRPLLHLPRPRFAPTQGHLPCVSRPLNQEGHTLAPAVRGPFGRRGRQGRACPVGESGSAFVAVKVERRWLRLRALHLDRSHTPTGAPRRSGPPGEVAGDVDRQARRRRRGLLPPKRSLDGAEELLRRARRSTRPLARRRRRSAGSGRPGRTRTATQRAGRPGSPKASCACGRPRRRCPGST